MAKKKSPGGAITPRLKDARVLNLRQKLELMRSELDNEVNSFTAHWRDLVDHILPRRGRFSITDANKGDRRNLKILDTTPTMAARTLRAGMMSGVTSPARPWFKLDISNQSISESGPVKEWLEKTRTKIANSFLRSNLYNVLPIIYGDIGALGTGCMFVEEDFTGEVMRFYPFPIGSYRLSQNEKLQVDKFYREFRMSVRQLVDKFGRNNPEDPEYIDWSVFSQHVRNQYDRGQLESWINVAHVVMPNKDYNEKKLESKYKKYISIYYERGDMGDGNLLNSSGYNDDRYLRLKGYDYFPVLAPRWEITGEDVYGTNCPGMVSLGDCKQLQTGEKKILQALEKTINPPMTAPISLQNQKISLLPGDTTFVDVREGQQGFRPVHEINFNIQGMEAKQEQVRARIQRAFFEDLFLMLAQSDRREITAREIEERHEEKLLALGPVLEQLNQDLLDPLIEIAFDIHMRQELIDPPPEEIQGQEIKVEYISIMAQAQKLVGVGNVERLAGFVGQVAAFNPDALDKLDVDQMIDVYGDMTSAPAKVIRTDDAVAGIREQRAQQQQQMQQVEAASQAAGAAKDLSQAKLNEESALDALLEGGPGI